MQKPNFFRVRIPIESYENNDKIERFLKDLTGSEVTLNFGEQRNRKEFKYLLEHSFLEIKIDSINNKKDVHFIMKFRKRKKV